MTSRRITLVGTAAALAAAVLLLGGTLREAKTAGTYPVSPFAVGPAASPTARTERLVRGLQKRVRANRQDVRALTQLGLAYQQRARETADPAYLTKSEGVLVRARRLRPSDPLVLNGLGSLALSRHRFREAFALGRRAQQLDPALAATYGVVGDALVELGRFGEAFRAFDAMARLEPGLASYARVSYARELLGRPRAAIEAMRLARDAAGREAEAAAWTRVELGKLYWSVGNLRAAAKEYEGALALFPGYVYALDSLAQVEAARGRYTRAIELARQAVETVPLPQFLATLGDLYRDIGKMSLAREQYLVVAAIRRLLAANGVKTDLDIALFNVDRGIDLRRTVQLARRGHAAQPSLFADDVLAWALMRNGRCDEALPFSRRALRLGTRNASWFFHRGMIERCLGRDAAARGWFQRALALNPHFSLIWAPVAQRYAA